MRYDKRDYNAYEVLGIDSGATPAEIQAAYRKKALETHPDKHPENPNATDEFKLIGEAYSILRNSTSRSAHDRNLGNLDLAHQESMQQQRTTRASTVNIPRSPPSQPASMQYDEVAKSESEFLCVTIQKDRTQGTPSATQQYYVNIDEKHDWPITITIKIDPATVSSVAKMLGTEHFTESAFYNIIVDVLQKKLSFEFQTKESQDCQGITNDFMRALGDFASDRNIDKDKKRAVLNDGLVGLEEYLEEMHQEENRSMDIVANFLEDDSHFDCIPENTFSPTNNSSIAGLERSFAAEIGGAKGPLRIAIAKEITELTKKIDRKKGAAANDKDIKMWQDKLGACNEIKTALINNEVIEKNDLLKKFPHAFDAAIGQSTTEKLFNKFSNIIKKDASPAPANSGEGASMQRNKR